MDTNYWRSLTTVFLKDANFVQTARLMNGVRAYEREQPRDERNQTRFRRRRGVEPVAHPRHRHHAIAIAGLVAGRNLPRHALLGGSWRWGIFCVLPSALAVLVKFAVMGWAGIPLGVATSMFAAMTLGIGVNCAIHLLEASAQARAAGASPADALSRVARSDRRARFDQHARRLAGVRRAHALTGSSQRAARHPCGAGSGELFCRVTAALAQLASLVAAGECEDSTHKIQRRMIEMDARRIAVNMPAAILFCPESEVTLCILRRRIGEGVKRAVAEVGLQGNPVGHSEVGGSLHEVSLSNEGVV